MPVIIRAETDMFRAYGIYSDMVWVNPCNTTGSADFGLSAEFKKRFPTNFEQYKKKCDAKSYQLGTIDVHKVKNEYVVNFITRHHWAEGTLISDIISGLKELKEFLKDKPFYQVVTPLIGTGVGREDYKNLYPYFLEHLNSLPNIIHVCMRPDWLSRKPRYLGIIGSRRFFDYDSIDLGVVESMLDWGIWSAPYPYQFFDGIVSGGNPKGVDAIAEEIARHQKIPMIRIPADWKKYGNSAGFRRNLSIVDVATHLVAFPCQHSVGTYHAIRRVEYINKRGEGDRKIISVLKCRV